MKRFFGRSGNYDIGRRARLLALDQSTACGLPCRAQEKSAEKSISGNKESNSPAGYRLLLWCRLRKGGYGDRPAGCRQNSSHGAAQGRLGGAWERGMVPDSEKGGPSWIFKLLMEPPIAGWWYERPVKPLGAGRPSSERKCTSEKKMCTSTAARPLTVGG